MPLSVIPTKLHAPRHTVALQRDRFTHKVSLLQKRLTLVSAPAGFGKTTLASQMIEGCSQPVAWLSLDANDAEPLKFLAGIVAALNKALPEELLSRLQASYDKLSKQGLLETYIEQYKAN